MTARELEDYIHNLPEELKDLQVHAESAMDDCSYPIQGFRLDSWKGIHSKLDVEFNESHIINAPSSSNR